ncbi:antihemorrhagic factor cHLP-B-like isoform X1 [Thamnophis elegans]|uniref:antihemorrhagic factor cHLP-B-like isoform X1 n=1 Tax=Thamnophis elegans TaxID=35005 RepID=UPI001376AA4A|nr:antihemorrhagic factor cHLP-B-like isoform X1 [Thamnophis elegans]
MNSLVALVLLGQIIGCTLSQHLEGWQFDCHDEEVEKLARVAVSYINEHSKHGYKQVVNQIKDAYALPQRPHGKINHLELNLLETVCHVLDPTPAENCSVRAQNHHAVEADCNVKLVSDEGVDKVVAAKCHSEPDSVEDVRQHCPKCPILLSLSDPHVINSANYVLHKHNDKLPHHAYEVLEISRGQQKFDPEGYYVEFAIVETNCTHQEAHDDNYHCDPKALGEAHFGLCRATVFRSHAATGKPTDEQYESDCVIFDVKDGHSHSHLVEHHFRKNIVSPGYNNTVLSLIHSHNHTSASHETHSHEHGTAIPPHVAKREVPTVPSHDHTHPIKLCPGKVHHFKV